MDSLWFQNPNHNFVPPALPNIINDISAEKRAIKENSVAIKIQKFFKKHK